MLARLISTGSLLDKGYLFWDEPETKSKPKTDQACRQGDLGALPAWRPGICRNPFVFLLREFEVLSQGKVFKEMRQCYFALKPTEKGVQVEQGDEVDRVTDVASAGRGVGPIRSLYGCRCLGGRVGI